MTITPVISLITDVGRAVGRREESLLLPPRDAVGESNKYYFDNRRGESSAERNPPLGAVAYRRNYGRRSTERSVLRVAVHRLRHGDPSVTRRAAEISETPAAIPPERPQGARAKTCSVMGRGGGVGGQRSAAAGETPQVDANENARWTR